MRPASPGRRRGHEEDVAFDGRRVCRNDHLHENVAAIKPSTTSTKRWSWMAASLLMLRERRGRRSLNRPARARRHRSRSLFEVGAAFRRGEPGVEQPRSPAKHATATNKGRPPAAVRIAERDAASPNHCGRTQ